MREREHLMLTRLVCRVSNSIRKAKLGLTSFQVDDMAIEMLKVVVDVLGDIIFFGPRRPFHGRSSKYSVIYTVTPSCHG